MTGREYNQWRAYERLEPFGDYRADLRNGILCSIVSNIMGGKAKPGDFMLEFDPGQKEFESSETIMGFLKAHAMATGTVLDQYGRKIN